MYYRKMVQLASLFIIIVIPALPCADTIVSGDLKIRDAGDLVFSDGSVQSKAQVQGPIGPQGVQGPAGSVNTLTIGTVTSGAQAAASITGAAPQQVLNITIPQVSSCQITLANICSVISTGTAPSPSFCAFSSIVVTPPNPVAETSTTKQFIASWIYSDGSTQIITEPVTWNSSDTNKATISSAGVASAVAAGTTTIKAISGSFSGATTLTVTDPVTGWTYGPPMPTASYWSASAVVGTDIYVFGGGDVGSTDANAKYDTLTKSWTSLPAMPFSDFLLRAANVNGQLYIFGGSMDSNKLVYRYDPSLAIWTKLKDMPATQWMSTPSVVNGKVYIFGGYDSLGQTAIKTTLEYTPSTDTWTTKAAMPTARYGSATAVYNNKIYVLGGHYGNSQNELYDPATNTWQTKAAVPFWNGGWGVAGEINGKIYFVNSYDSKMAVYFTNTDSWISVGGLNTPREYMTGETVNGKLYVIGGKNVLAPYDSTNIVEIYSPPNVLTPALGSLSFSAPTSPADLSELILQKHLNATSALRDTRLK